MRYIEEILQPGEKVLFAGTLHWIVYLPAVLMLMPRLGRADASGVEPDRNDLVACRRRPRRCRRCVTALHAWFRRWTTEIDVTDRRIVYKRGFISRHTVEMNMDKVESVDVDQSVLGRMLDYGDITIHGTGIGIEPLRSIGSPLDFRNHVTAR